MSYLWTWRRSSRSIWAYQPDERSRVQSAYAEMFEVIGQLRVFGKSSGSARDDFGAASSKIIKFSKKQICGIIDAIDDAAVAANFHEYLDKRIRASITRMYSIRSSA
jgi:hypothetical protein